MTDVGSTQLDAQNGVVNTPAQRGAEVKNATPADTENAEREYHPEKARWGNPNTFKTGVYSKRPAILEARAQDEEALAATFVVDLETYGNSLSIRAKDLVKEYARLTVLADLYWAPYALDDDPGARLLPWTITKGDIREKRSATEYRRTVQTKASVLSTLAKVVTQGGADDMDVAARAQVIRQQEKLRNSQKNTQEL